MEKDLWYEDALNLLKKIAEENETILSLSLFGSLSNEDVKKDRWSDIDAFVVLKDNALDQFYPTLDWLKPFGSIFTSTQTRGNKWSVTHKVYFEDFKRLDIILTTESELMHPDAQWTRQRFIFSRSEDVTKLLEEKALKIIYPKKTESKFDDFVNEFWYIAVVATTKVIRNDMLISLHLALELYRKCLESGMLLRDKETGTNIHRTGGVINDLPDKMNIRLEGMSKRDILHLIEQCAKEFDALALKQESGYKLHFPVFEKLLVMAQEDI